MRFQAEYVTDNGPVCPGERCGTRLYGYRVVMDAGDWIAEAQCASCHARSEFVLADGPPHDVRDLAQVHRLIG